MSLSHPFKSRIATPVAWAGRMGQAANAAAAHTAVARFLRFGYVVRGVLYLLLGVFAVQLALGAHRAAISQTGAIAMIGRQPFGRVLLVLVAIGLAGYALWGTFRAVLDPLHKGHSPRGLATRMGFAMSALAYAGLFAGTLGLLAGTSTRAAATDWTAGLLARPYGAWLVGLIGLCWIAGAGLGEIVRGWRASFEHDLALEHMSSTEREWALPLGRIGTVARGCVFTITGLLLVAAAMHFRSDADTGLDGSLRELARQPFGQALLLAAALGLLAFGAYSVMCARWMRMGDAPPAPRTPSSPPPFARGPA